MKTLSIKTGVTAAALAFVVGITFWQYAPYSRAFNKTSTGEANERGSESAAKRALAASLANDPVVEDYRNSPMARTSAMSLFESARHSQDVGQIQRAVNAVNHCRIAVARADLGPPTLGGETNKTRERQRVAAEIIQQFCAAVSPSTPTRSEVDELVGRGAALGSPSLSVLAAIHEHIAGWQGRSLRNDARLCEAFKDARRDPDALVNLIPAITTVSRDSLFGKPFTGADLGTLGEAIDVAACRLGRDCKAGSWNLMSACAFYGACNADDLVGFALRPNTETNSPAGIEYYSQSIISAIDRKDCTEILGTR